MNIHNYLIAQDGIDFRRMFGNWRWLLSGGFTVWLINRFGDVFAVQKDGTVWWLALDAGTFTKIAESKDEFGKAAESEDRVNDWLMIPLVDRLVAAGKTLGPKECYAFRQLPILGGDYVVENVTIRNLEEQYAALGPIYEKLKNVPDGTKVTFSFENEDTVRDRE